MITNNNKFISIQFVFNILAHCQPMSSQYPRQDPSSLFGPKTLVEEQKQGLRLLYLLLQLGYLIELRSNATVQNERPTQLVELSL